MRKVLKATVLAAAALSVPLAGVAREHTSYVKDGDIDLLTVLPPAPKEGDARAEADRVIFRATRQLENSPRWTLATNDVSEKTDYMFHAYSCAMGLDVTEHAVPKLAHLLETAADVTSDANRAVKKKFKRPRPFNFDDGPICQLKIEMASYDYPSGHTTHGWTWALILAELIPERANAILARGRAYGESRIVCGAHNASAVEAGRLSATISMTRLRSSPAFQADLAAAKEELAALTVRPQPDAAQCQAEADALATPVL